MMHRVVASLEKLREHIDRTLKIALSIKKMLCLCLHILELTVVDGAAQ